MEKAKRFPPPSLTILELRVINGRLRIEKRKLYFTCWRVTYRICCHKTYWWPLAYGRNRHVAGNPFSDPRVQNVSSHGEPHPCAITPFGNSSPSLWHCKQKKEKYMGCGCLVPSQILGKAFPNWEMIHGGIYPLSSAVALIYSRFKNHVATFGRQFSCLGTWTWISSVTSILALKCFKGGDK